jgi:hypothetical protein
MERSTFVFSEHFRVELRGRRARLYQAELKKLGAALARHIGEEESDKIRHFYQRLAILLVKGNAALFLNRLPKSPQSHD